MRVLNEMEIAAVSGAGSIAGNDVGLPESGPAGGSFSGLSGIVPSTIGILNIALPMPPITLGIGIGSGPTPTINRDKNGGS